MDDDNNELGREKTTPTPTTPTTPQVNPKVLRTMKQLGGWFNPDANAIVNANQESGREEDEDEEDNHNNTNDIANLLINGSHFRTERVFLANESIPHKQQFTEPTTFAEAWHHPDEDERKLWREAIRAEFRSMIKRGVWQKVQRSTIPNGKQCVKCKWVFKIKRDGRHKARLVACGYKSSTRSRF